MLTYILAYLFSGVSRSYRKDTLRESECGQGPLRLPGKVDSAETPNRKRKIRNVDWYIDSPGDGVNRHQREFNLCINRHRGTKAGMLTIRLAPSRPVSGVSDVSWLCVLVISAPDLMTPLNRIEYPVWKKPRWIEDLDLENAVITTATWGWLSWSGNNGISAGVVTTQTFACRVKVSYVDKTKQTLTKPLKQNKTPRQKP